MGTAHASQFTNCGKESRQTFLISPTLGQKDLGPYTNPDLRQKDLRTCTNRREESGRRFRTARRRRAQTRACAVHSLAPSCPSRAPNKRTHKPTFWSCANVPNTKREWKTLIVSTRDNRTNAFEDSQHARGTNERPSRHNHPHPGPSQADAELYVGSHLLLRSITQANNESFTDDGTW